jgi:hypothetical protein
LVPLVEVNGIQPDDDSSVQSHSKEIDLPREENLAAYKAQRKTKPNTRPKPHTDSADTARRRDEIERQLEADRQAELRRRIPTATTAKTPRRKPMTRDEELALAVDLAIRREPAFKKSARSTRLSSFARDWVFGKARRGAWLQPARS